MQRKSDQTPWPNDLPFDLRKRLDRALNMRSCGAADLWGEIKEWLEAHKIEPPEDLPGASVRDFMGPK